MSFVISQTHKSAARLATTANHALSGLASIDGITPAAGDRILVRAQTSPAANGIYIALPGAWARAYDADTTLEMKSGQQIFVSEGSLYANTLWHLTTANPIVLDTTSLSFSQFSGSGTSAVGGTGAIQFANGTSFAADASKFFWDNTNKRLGIGTATPSYDVDAVANSNSAPRISITNSNGGSSAQAIFQALNDAGNGIQFGMTSTTFSSASIASGEGYINVNSGPLALQSSGSNPIRILPNGIERARYLPDGKYGFGDSNTTPSSRFSIKSTASENVFNVRAQNSGNTTFGSVNILNDNTGFGNLLSFSTQRGSNLSINSYDSGSNLKTRLGINYALSSGNGTTEFAIVGAKKAPVIELSAETGTISLLVENGTGADFRSPSYATGLTVLSSGETGIGTASPSQKLEVAGTIYSTTGGFKFPDGTTQATAASGGGTPAGSSGYVQFNSSGSFAGDSNFYWDNTNKRLGVGGTPADTVHVQLPSVGANSYLRLDSGTATSFSTRFGTTAANQYAWFTNISYNGSAFVRDNGSRGAWRFNQVAETTDATSVMGFDYFNVAAGTYSNVLTALGTGNVGIGTTTPISYAKLHVAVAGNERLLVTNKSTDASTMLQVQDSAGSNNNYILFGIDTDGSTVGYATGGDFLSAGTNGSGTPRDLVVMNYDNNSVVLATSHAPRVTVTGGGSVGIGTTSPSQKLEVAGTIYSTTGGFKFPDGTTQITAGTGSPGGSTTQVQYNNAGSFAGSAGLVYDDTAGELFLTKNHNADTTILSQNSTSGTNAYAGVEIIGQNSVMQLNALSAGYTRNYAGFHPGSVQVYSGATNGLNIISGLGSGSAGANTGLIRFVTSNADITGSTPGNDADTRMVINASGSVGIGTTNPLALLHSYTSANTSTEIARFDNPNSGSSASSYITMATSDRNGYLEQRPSNDGTFIAGMLRLQQSNEGIVLAADGSSGIIKLNTGGNGAGFERVRILSNGSVGIGTTNPSSRLHTYVSSNSSTEVARFDNPNSGAGARSYITVATSDRNGYIEVHPSNAGTFIAGMLRLQQSNEGIALTADNAVGIIKFHTGGDGNAFERVRIASDGKVGIGTTTPNSNLTIIGSTANSIATISANTVLDDTYSTVLVDATSGNITITLPAVASISGRKYVIKKIDSSANTVIIDANSSETIDGSLTQTLTGIYEALNIQTNGTAWYII